MIMYAQKWVVPLNIKVLYILQITIITIDIIYFKQRHTKTKQKKQNPLFVSRYCSTGMQAVQVVNLFLSIVNNFPHRQPPNTQYLDTKHSSPLDPNHEINPVQHVLYRLLQTRLTVQTFMPRPF